MILGCGSIARPSAQGPQPPPLHHSIAWSIHCKTSMSTWLYRTTYNFFSLWYAQVQKFCKFHKTMLLRISQHLIPDFFGYNDEAYYLLYIKNYINHLHFTILNKSISFYMASLTNLTYMYFIHFNIISHFSNTTIAIWGAWVDYPLQTSTKSAVCPYRSRRS